MNSILKIFYSFFFMALPLSAIEKPNIVLIMADDLGMGDVSFTGGNIATPHLDALAQSGVIFSDFHSNGVVCTPTRAALLTGRYQQRSGVTDILNDHMTKIKDDRKNHGIPKGFYTIADALKSADYRTGIFGKWHVGYEDGSRPLQQGFDEFVGNLGGCIDFFTQIHPRSKYVDWWSGDEKKKEEGYTTHLINQHSVNFIEKHKDRPFFVYVSHTAPHTPLQGPDGQGKKQSKEEAYPQMIQEIDRGVGQIVETLKKNNLLEKTLIVFTADNGHSKHSPGSAGIYREKKGTNYEGGHRVPTFINWPGKIAGGRSSDALAMTFDLMPTFMEVAGVTAPGHIKLDGSSLKNHLIEQASFSQRDLFWKGNRGNAMRSQDWKLIHNPKSGKSELFDLKQDLGEKSNLAKKYPEKLQDMLKKFKLWEASM